MKSSLLILLFSFTLASSSSATTFRTIYSGYWTDNSVWQNGIAPSVTSTDTIIIRHLIEYNSKLSFQQNAYVRIDSTGILCGHDTIIFNSGTAMDVYGVLQCDVFLVPGGYILFFMAPMSSGHSRLYFLMAPTFILTA